jgi:hypothetical protein
VTNGRKVGNQRACFAGSRREYTVVPSPTHGARRRGESVSELSQKASELIRAGRGDARPSMTDRDRVSAALRARLGEGALLVDRGSGCNAVERSRVGGSRVA